MHGVGCGVLLPMLNTQHLE